MKRYIGIPEQGPEDIAGEVFIDDGGARRPLPLRLDLRNHSPSGFAWNYGGSGPAQLALALLADVADDAVARAFYQAFKNDHIARLGTGPWELEESTIAAWIRDHKERQL